MRWRRALLAPGAALLLLAALDLSRPPERQATAAALLAGIDLYQATASPALARVGARCRFEPTCSHYAEGAIRHHGALGGVARAAWRVARCGPWTPEGTLDPADGRSPERAVDHEEQ
jgi:putative membrane protein insertion efficiency factor